IGDVLDGNGGLTTTDAFANASNYFLEDAQALAYVNVPPIADIATGLAELGVPDMEDVALVLPAFESASITASYDDEGNGVVRLVLSLAD
ncbi:MAG: hypothetical protein AAFQ52_03985, partial [Chloroflexota bacterium]